MESPELVLCNKTERVTIFKLPPLNTTQGYLLDSWTDMIWEGGVKVTEKSRVITITFIDKHDKVFGQTKVPQNYKQAIVKTRDSSRGYAVRLENPRGGYVWVGVAFRDRNDAFDFGVAFQDQAERNGVNQKKLNQEFGKDVDFGLKKGEKIKINVGGSKKQTKPVKATGGNPFDFDFGQANQPEKVQQKSQSNNDWANFDFGASSTTSSNNNSKKSSNASDLLDL